MKNKVTCAGYLKIGQYKSIQVTCNLKIEVIPDDEWGETLEYNSDEYLNGVRIEGDLYFDSPPLQSYYQDGRWYKHPVQKGVMATLSLHQGDECSHFNIILTDKVSEIAIIPKQLIRYFWKFFPIGNPMSDNLGIFPDQYRWNNQMNRVYYCTDFRGAWPLEVSSVVVAPDKKKARQLLDAELKLIGIQLEGGEMYTLTEIDLTKEKAIVLSNGS